MSAVEIIGRSSSHFTRVTLVVAHELGVPVTLVPVYDMTRADPVSYAGNPALKLPTLRRADGSLVFGTENICRTLADLAAIAATTPSPHPRIVWPEDLREDVSRNAQELVWHAMAAQVQVIVATVMGKLPADNLFLAKGRAGFEGALRWLDDNLASALAALPTPRDTSLFEISLYCLVDHVAWRTTLPLVPYPSLVAFAARFATRPSAQHTPYRFDAPPS